MATHSHILAWGIPWTEEPGRLQSRGSHRATDAGGPRVRDGAQAKLRIPRAQREPPANLSAPSSQPSGPSTCGQSEVRWSGSPHWEQERHPQPRVRA